MGLQGELLSNKKVQRSVKLSRDMMVRRLMNEQLSEDEEDDDMLQFRDLRNGQKKRRLTANDSPSP